MATIVRRFATLVLTAALGLLLWACAPATASPAPDLQATEQAIRAEVVATLTAEAPAATDTPEPTATDAPPPTETPAPADTPVPTDTPAPTPAPTDTPIPTPMPTDTPAPTPEAATPTPEPPAAAPSSYTVQSGDSLSKIAGILGVPLDALATYNEITDPSTIWVGQVIEVPPEGYVVPTVVAPSSRPTATLVPVAPSDGPSEAQRYAIEMLLPATGIAAWLQDMSDLFVDTLASDPFAMCLGESDTYDSLVEDGAALFLALALVEPPKDIAQTHQALAAYGFTLLEHLRAAKLSVCQDADVDAFITHMELATDAMLQIGPLARELAAWMEANQSGG